MNIQDIRNNGLIEADQENGAFRGLRFVGNFLGALAVVVFDANAYPPVAGRAVVAENFRGVIALGYMIGDFGGGFVLSEATDLYSPASSGIQWCRGFQDFDVDRGNSGTPNIYFLGGCEGEIKNSSLDKRAAVGDANNGRVSCFWVGDTHNCAHGKVRCAAVNACML